ncbi:MAG TPA: response regulator transcription factor [Fimbriimonadaceae bacterium]|nr:response regulator transcription factor [Fimbriimonadaceae bacterium]
MRIAICSRNRLFREGLACILKAEEEAQIVALAASAKECLRSSSHQRAEVLIIDRQDAQQADIDYVLGLQLYEGFGLVLVAGDGHDTSGFKAVVPYRKAGFDLIKAVRAAAGRTPPRRRTRNVPGPDNPPSLSPRESQIAGMIAKGYSNRKIAEEIGLKEVTVKNFVALILRKLGCGNRIQVALRLAAEARTQGSNKE